MLGIEGPEKNSNWEAVVWWIPNQWDKRWSVASYSSVKPGGVATQYDRQYCTLSTWY